MPETKHRRRTWRRAAGRLVARVSGVRVHDGEWTLVLLLCAAVFSLLTAYYLLKVIREPLILLAGGAVRRSYARGAEAAVLALTIPVYSLVANRVEMSQLVKWVLASFAVTLTTFALWGPMGPWVAFVFFVWLGVFSTVSVAQFWSLANDVFSPADGRRLFPLVAIGGTVGAVVGAQLAGRLLGWLGYRQIMLLAVAFLAQCILLIHLAHRHALRWPRWRPAEAAPRDLRGGFILILRDRYLGLIAGAVVLLNLIKTTGDFLLARLVKTRADMAVGAARTFFIGDFYASYQTWVTVLTAGVQIFLVGRLFRTVGLGRSLFLLPLLVLCGYGASALVPVLGIIAAVNVLQNGTEYSIQNTIQQALFLHTSRDAKYKAKAATDTFLVRVGDLGSMGLVALGTALDASVLAFALVNMVAALGWLWIVLHLARRQRSWATPPRAPADAARPDSWSRDSRGGS